MLHSIVQALLPVAFVVLLGWASAALLLLVLALGIKNNAGKELILTGAIPSATAVSMFAVKYGVYTARTSASTLISTVLSVVTISLTIAFVTRWP
jgi:predicted permease